MNLPEIDPKYRSPIPRSEVETACWSAQDLLVSYSIYDDSADLFEPEIIRPSDKTFYDGLHHKRTRCREVSESVIATADSVPILLDDKDTLYKLVEPGFVAILFIDTSDFSTLIHDRSTADISPDTTQIIFRLPWHSDGAGIFQGFGISEDSLVTDTEEIEAVMELLESFRSLLQDDLVDEAEQETSGFGSSEPYAVQNYPIVPFASLFLEVIEIDKAKKKD